MSGDVQPRKRKDKKRKKDDLGIEEPRGTAAAFGEGDVFLHSHHDHGTGGHWCAKIIFFSLLAVLITLIGLIILENRGLTELEANAVESRYSGVLEGWLEDAPDDDHHDEHTLELTHHDDDDDEEHHEFNQLEDEDHDEDEEHNSDEDHDGDDDDEDHDADDDDDYNSDEDEEQDDDDNEHDHDDEDLAENDDDEDKDTNFRHGDDDDDDNDDEEQDHNEDELDNDDDDSPHFEYNNEDEEQEDNKSNQEDDEDDQNDDEEKYYSRYEVQENDEMIDESNEIDHVQDADSIENNDDDDNDEDEEDHEEEDGNDEDDGEVEKLEKEERDEEPISTELPALLEDDDDDKDDDDDQNNTDDDDDKHSDKEEGDVTEEESDQDGEEFLEDDTDEPPVERITAPAGKPLPEVEEEQEVSSEQPPDTLKEEEEYEKRQEELRREEEQSSHMWLKLTVGGALLVATHAVMRRATHSRDEADDEQPVGREETPLSDRRLTLIPEEHAKHVPVTKFVEGIARPSVDKVVESAASMIKPTFAEKQEFEDEEEKYSDEEEAQEIVISTEDNKELYSDEEEEADVDDEVVEEPKQISKQSINVVESKPEVAVAEPEEEIEEDDVEIIDDEQIEEELEEEDEEEISDVDDAELLTRLEAKYGKLPEPERPGPKNYKDGGNSIDDEWPGEPSDAYWRGQLDSAERELLQGAWSDAAARIKGAPDCARARWIAARSLDIAAESRRDNKLLSQAIAAYLHLLKMNERLPDKKLLQVAERTLDRIQFRGNYLNAEPVYRLLIRRFPNEPGYRNNLTISFLMANRVDLAEEALQETLKRWPNDRLALAHYGFVLKTKHNRYEEAAEAFRKALEGDTGPANEARFYYHYGDSLLLLGRPAEAHEVHKRGAALGHFLSPAQRSLYNVPRLKSSPWWKIENTPYLKLAKALEKSWKEILKEAEAAKALYEKEKEGLKERGEWSQLDLFVRGREIPKRCDRAPVTCSIVKSEIAAAGCRRGQIKFSAMEAGTHVRAHVGPTNCRLRMHLGLSNTKDTYIRVDQEIRQWQEGKTLMFDDSFEHEVWHNGTGTRLVLIVDVWHPDLTAAERRQLPAI